MDLGCIDAEISQAKVTAAHLFSGSLLLCFNHLLLKRFSAADPSSYILLWILLCLFFFSCFIDIILGHFIMSVTCFIIIYSLLFLSFPSPAEDIKSICDFISLLYVLWYTMFYSSLSIPCLPRYSFCCW